MNKTSDPGLAAHHDLIATASGALEVAAEAAQRGAVAAREAASRTLAATGECVNRLVYRASYTVSYAVVFPLALIALSIPRNNAAVRGLIDGAGAAKRQVDQLFGTSPATVSARDAPVPATAHA